MENKKEPFQKYERHCMFLPANIPLDDDVTSSTQDICFVFLRRARANIS
jgi:hypothetical protein